MSPSRAGNAVIIEALLEMSLSDPFAAPSG
jgi:hypothetical protein